MRRPHVGQSLRSFWAGWSHQLQKRSVSTAHGSLDADGGSGSSLPTISSGSPRLAIPVRVAGLGLQDHLAAGRRRPEAISLPDHGGAA